MEKKILYKGFKIWFFCFFSVKSSVCGVGDCVVVKIIVVIVEDRFGFDFIFIWCVYGYLWFYRDLIFFFDFEGEYWVYICICRNIYICIYVFVIFREVIILRVEIRDIYVFYEDKI